MSEEIKKPNEDDTTARGDVPVENLKDVVAGVNSIAYVQAIADYSASEGTTPKPPTVKK